MSNANHVQGGAAPDGTGYTVEYRSSSPAT